MILEVIDVEESFLELLRFGIPSGGFPVSALQVLMRLRLLLFQGGAALCFPSSSRRLLGNGVHRGVPGGLSFFSAIARVSDFDIFRVYGIIYTIICEYVRLTTNSIVVVSSAVGLDNFRHPIARGRPLG
jgi:hypothetical protein